MDAWRMRPRFKEKLDVQPHALMDALRDELQRAESPFVGTVLRHHAMLTIRASERHFWSPHLSLDVVQEEEGIKQSAVAIGRTAALEEAKLESLA